MNRPRVYDGTDVVRQEHETVRPTSVRGGTSDEAERATNIIVRGQNPMSAPVMGDDEYFGEEERRQEDVPMTEDEIRALEEDPPATPPQQELPLQFPTKGPGVYTTYRGPAERLAYLADKKELKRLEKFEQKHAELAAHARDARGTLGIEEQKLRDLRQEAASNPNLAPQKLFYQEQEVEKAWARLTKAEMERDAAELKLHHQSEKTSEIERAVNLEEMNMATLASARQQDEVRRARHKVRGAEADLAREAEEERIARSDQERRDAAADFHQTKGKQRLHAEQQKSKEKDKVMDDLRDSHFDHKAQRHLKLKDSMTRISNSIHSENERRKKKDAARLEAQLVEKKELVAAGLNPYEVFRRRELEEEQRKQKVKASALKQMRQEHLLEKMDKEDIILRKEEKVEESERQAAAEFQREMGGLERRRKVASYIQEQTIDNVGIVDPTGKAMRIDPSKVTIQKTMDFGLGNIAKEKPELLERLRKKLEATEKALMVDIDGRRDDMDDEIFVEEGEEIDGEGGGDSPKKIQLRQLSKFEKDCMAAAAKRQSENITSVQKCWGREFSGDAFLADPAVIAFTDFEVGQRYKKVIKLTNVSLTFNQFKLLPLDDMINDFFEIEFHPPGRMSAGTTCTLELTFIPKKNRDIYTCFPILSKTGPIAFPLQATTKKTVLTITPQDPEGRKIVDMGDVLRGEYRDKQLTVVNKGKLGGDFTLAHTEDTEFTTKMVQMALSAREFEDHRKIDRNNREVTGRFIEGRFPEKDITKISFRFTPTEVGSFDTTLCLRVDNPMVDDQIIIVRGTCIDVPVYVEKPVYDFRTIIAGHVFREKVVLHNRRGSTMKFKVVEPREIDGELSYNPSTVFIQGNSTVVIQFKLSPREDFLRRHPSYAVKGSKDQFRIPVKFRGKDQELPVCTALVGSLTTNEMSFEPAWLNFTSCFVDQTVAMEVSVMNHSLLSQRFAFVRVPSYLSIQAIPPDVADEEHAENHLKEELARDEERKEEALAFKGNLGWKEGVMSEGVLDGGGYGGFGLLLPKETIRLLVTWTPQAATEMSTSLNFKVQSASLCAREFSLACRGQGVLPALRFSQTMVEMAAIPSGAVIKESIEVTNVTKVPQKLNLLVPDDVLARLYVCPQCCVLEAKETRRIQFEFKPHDAYLKSLDRDTLLNKDQPVEEKPVDEEEEEEKEEEEKEEEEEEEKEEISEEETARLKAEADAKEAEESETYAKELVFARNKIREAGGRRWTSSQNTHHCLWKIPVCVRAENSREPAYKSTYLALRTCAVPHVVTATPVSLNFKEVTVGQRVIKRIVIRNMTAEQVQNLRMESLPQNACFTVLNALRPVAGRPFQIAVEFRPADRQVYSTVLRLHTQDTRVQVPLKGKGVCPVLAIEPEDGIVDFGACMYRRDANSSEPHDYITKNIKIKNDSAYEMKYSLDNVMVSETNHFGVQPFTATPGTAIVPGNGEQIVEVKFQPHRPCEYYRHKILVNVPNQQRETYFSFYGACFKYQMYCLYDKPPVMLESVDRESVYESQIPIGEEDDPDTATSKKMELTFEAKPPQDEDGGTEIPPQYLVLGATVPLGTKGAGAAGAGGKFDFQMQPSVSGTDFSKYFSVEPAKGDVPAGSTTKVAFTFKPPAERDLDVQGLTLDLLDDIGQWVSATVTGTLETGADKQTVTVKLKAYLCQI